MVFHLAASMTKQELIDILINDFKLMFPETNKWQREQLKLRLEYLDFEDLKLLVTDDMIKRFKKSKSND